MMDLNNVSTEYTEAEGYAEFQKLKKAGIFGEAPVKWEHINYPAVAVKVQTAISDDAALRPLAWNVAFVDKRGVKVVMSDWAMKPTSSGQRVLEFIVHMRIPKCIAHRISSGLCADNLVCSYRDLLWLHGHEDIDTAQEIDVNTLKDGCADYADLGWILPCRFADQLVEVLGRANEYVLGGTMEDALLYGLLSLDKGNCNGS